MTEPKDGLIFGYDPGGNGKHGVACLTIESQKITDCESATLKNAKKVLEWFYKYKVIPLGIGVDTLTAWSMGDSGWRPADEHLKKILGVNHQNAGDVNDGGNNPLRSVISSNSLHGAMSVNGMAVILKLREKFSGLPVTEAHPRALYNYLTAEPRGMDCMAQWLTGEPHISNKCPLPWTQIKEHERDAVISALAMYMGLTGQWIIDLHRLPDTSELIFPAGECKYYWPC